MALSPLAIMQHNRSHSVDRRNWCQGPCRPPLYPERFLFQTIFSLVPWTKCFQHKYGSTVGLDPSRSIKDWGTFGAHLELPLLHTASTLVFYIRNPVHAYQNHSVIWRFTSISIFKVFSIYKERQP